MKNKLILLIGCVLLISITSKAQSPLLDTYWRVSIKNGSGSFILNFKTDTIFFAEFLDEAFIPHRKYGVNGDILSLQSISTPACSKEIIGQYKYTIIDSLMSLSLR